VQKYLDGAELMVYKVRLPDDGSAKRLAKKNEKKKLTREAGLCRLQTLSREVGL
jgi:hypothetical protein